MTKSKHFIILIGLFAAISSALIAATPKLDLRAKSGTPIELRKKEQIERLAAQYDLTKYTITRRIEIEQGAVAHSYPVLTLNGRFLDDDDLALSQYIHEQGHWVLMERHRRDMPQLFNDLRRMFPNMSVEPPQGDGNERSTYFHIAVIMLEWQGVEDLVGADRAIKVMHFKQGDHYIAIYTAVLNNRPAVESLLRKYGIHF